MTFALAMILGSLLPAPAADDLFKGIKMGDRVEITLKSEFSIRGRLIQPGIDEQGKPVIKADPKTDLSTLVEITLDISMEYPDMAGYMGFHRVQIAATRWLRDLTPEEAQAIEKERQRLLGQAEKENAARRARSAKDEQERLKEIEEAVKRNKTKELDKLGSDLQERINGLKKAAEIYKKFPPEAGWGPEKIKAITDKARLHLPVTPEESEFAGVIEQWTQYDQYLKGEKDKKDDMAAPAPVAPPESK